MSKYTLSYIRELLQRGLVYGYQTKDDPNYINRIFLSTTGEVGVKPKGFKTKGVLLSESKIQAIDKLLYYQDLEAPSELEEYMYDFYSELANKTLDTRFNCLILESPYPDYSSWMISDRQPYLLSIAPTYFQTKPKVGELTLAKSLLGSITLGKIMHYYNEVYHPTQNKYATSIGEYKVYCVENTTMYHGTRRDYFIGKGEATYMFLSMRMLIRIK